MTTDQLRSTITTHMLATPARLPTSAVGRLGYVALTAARGGRLAVVDSLRKRAARGDLNPATLTKLVTGLGQLKGVAMKVGQLLSYLDVPLPNDARTALATLQTHAPALSIDTVRDIVTRELGLEGRKLAAALEAEPVAAASIGQVHRATLADGSRVAVKVQYPGIVDAIRKDFAPAALGGSLTGLIYPGVKIDGFVRTARARFVEECNYLHEAAVQRRFVALFADHPTVVVPTVHDAYSNQRVLTTSWADGMGLDAYLATGPSQDERNRLGAALFEVYLGALFRYGLYNCDPHPGNYLVQPDGRLAVLDYGCSRELPADWIEKLGRLTTAVQADDRIALHAALVDLDIAPASGRYDDDAARRLLRGLYGPMLRNEVCAFDAEATLRMRQLVAEKGRVLKLHLPGEFLFLLRVRLGLAAVLARLGARANWFELERGYVREHLERQAEKRDPHSFCVVLGDIGENEIQIIRELRTALGVDIKQAKQWLETLPHTIDRRLTRSAADTLAAQLRSVGGAADVVRAEQAPKPQQQEPALDADKLAKRKRRARRLGGVGRRH